MAIKITITITITITMTISMAMARDKGNDNGSWPKSLSFHILKILTFYKLSSLSLVIPDIDPEEENH